MQDLMTMIATLRRPRLLARAQNMAHRIMIVNVTYNAYWGMDHCRGQVRR